MTARTPDFPGNIDRIVHALRQARIDWRSGHARHAEQGIHFPSRRALERIARELGVALFPLRLGPPELTAANENAYVAATLESTLSQLAAQIRLERLYRREDEGDDAAREATAIVGRFADALPGIRRLLDGDVVAIYASDPAARSVDEVLIAYPSLLAIIHYRLAHVLHGLGAPLVARLVTEVAHRETGIDIHPGARIGHSFSIDHGTGLVIGETALVGDRVRLHQGVTLGGDPDAARTGGDPAVRRHPAIGDDVIVHANASIIGPVTVGARSRIGWNVCVRRDVAADQVVEPAEPDSRASPGPRSPDLIP